MLTNWCSDFSFFKLVIKKQIAKCAFYTTPLNVNFVRKTQYNVAV